MVHKATYSEQDWKDVGKGILSYTSFSPFKKISLRKINADLRKKGFGNTEVTRKGNDYFVLHILKNGIPVPVFKTQDTHELKNYIEVHYPKKVSQSGS
jgi:hypothetical protein